MAIAGYTAARPVPRLGDLHGGGWLTRPMTGNDDSEATGRRHRGTIINKISARSGLYHCQ